MFLRERIHGHGKPLKRVRRAEFHRANISRGRHGQTRGIRLGERTLLIGKRAIYGLETS